MKNNYDLIVAGGGAAGIFSALRAAALYPNINILVIEKSNKLLSKVKISGGGRCNVCPSPLEINELVKFYPRGFKELRQAFNYFNVSDTINWFESRGVKLKQEPDGRMFPVTDDSQTIIDCLLKEAHKFKISFALSTAFEGFDKIENEFIIRSNKGDFNSKYLIIACGGGPKINFFNWALNHDIKVVDPVPSLFTFNIPSVNWGDLMGASLTNVSIELPELKVKEKGPFLITHWGFSGPAAIKLSAKAAFELAQKQYQTKVKINWTGTLNDDEFAKQMEDFAWNHRKKSITNYSVFDIPARVWKFLCHRAGIVENKDWTELSKKEFFKLQDTVLRDIYIMEGKTTFKEEFVSAGGIDKKEIDFKTMQVKKIPNLFVVGESLDIDGLTGGYNFQSAWTTGFIAGSLAQ